MTQARPANRLIDSTSPYLLQHAHNPVDWHPWGEEALRRSRQEDRPIFLSIGYAACHWCHVMERESFESEAVAEVLNREFIPIKVDREERPDLDEIYMTATQLMTGSGGWPMSVFLTPDLKPFYAGTYFPPDDRWGRPGFKTLLTELARLWKTQRPDLEKRASQASAAIAEIGSSGEGEGDLQPELVRRAVAQLSRGFDPVNGGFGGAPKFPPSMRLELLLRHLDEHPESRKGVELTLERMARGGMYDQVGGGFHRYSVDSEWLVPHFEKMLYDNALLSRVYILAYERTGDWYTGRVAREILDYVLREMTSPEGGFYSTTDADSEGEEGKFFVWSPEEVRQVLGPEDGELFCRVYDVTPRGNFEGHSIPNLLPKSLAEQAAALETDAQDLDARLAPLRRKLWEHREQRVHPLLDDKILAAWNGLMVRALAEGWRVFRDERYRGAAERAAGFVLERMRDEKGALLRSYRGGRAHLNAYLEDYAYLAAGLLDLHAATGSERWLDEGLKLLDRMHQRFWDEAAGGYFFTSHDHEALIARVKSLQDNATPSGNSMAALALIRAARLTGRDDYRERAARLLSGLVPQMEEMPAAFPNAVVAADEFLVEWPQGSRRPGADAVELEAYVSRASVAPGEVFWVGVRLGLKEGFHVNSSNPSQPYQIATRLVLESGLHFSVARESYPPGQPYESGGESLSVYTGEALMGLEIRVGPETELGRHEIVVSVVTQPCDEQACYPPVQGRVRFPMEVTEDGGPDRHADIFDAVRANAGPLLD